MKRPWHDRAEELREKEGDWCDYIAWREWFAAQGETRDGNSDGDALLHVLDDAAYTHINAIMLYCIFGKAFDSLPAPVEQTR